MTWLPLDTWIVIIAALCAVSCALPGCFLVLRRMSMMGDAISHAVLPGLALGYLISGSRTSFAMFAGAAATGVLTAWFIQWISNRGKVDHGASMGIVFTTLFAIGLLLIVQAADHVDLDPDCVLFGALEMTPLDIVHTFTMGGYLFEIPRAAITLAVVLFVNLAIIIFLFKEFRISSFDPALATVQGFSANRMHYLLMTMVAITTVASFEAVGSILVIAMLIVPPATALLLTRSLFALIVVSTIVAVLCAVLGHLAALLVPPLLGFESTNTSGMMATMAGLLFFMCALVQSLRQRHQQRNLEQPAPLSPVP